MEDQALKNYFHFDEGDLMANRNGQLSPKQQQALVSDQKSGRLWGVVGGFGCGLGLLAIASIFPIVFIPVGLASLQSHEAGGAIGAFIGAGVWALIWGGIGVFALWSGFSSIVDKPTPLTLQRVAGPVNLVGVERTSGGEHHHTYIQHELHIGGQEWDVDSSLAGYIMQGDVYAVYFVVDEGIQSLERLSAARPA